MKRVVLSIISVMILITVCIGMTASERQDKYVTVFHPDVVKTQEVMHEFFEKEDIEIDKTDVETVVGKKDDEQVQSLIIENLVKNEEDETIGKQVIEKIELGEENVTADGDSKEAVIIEEKSEYSGVVYLTFDDGPVEAITVPILDVLKEYGVPATFFTLGSYGEKNPEILKRQAEEGHTVANHSYSHQKKIFNSLDTFKKEIEKTNNVIKDATGKDVKFIRIPYGTKLNNAYKEYLNSIGMESISWNCESYDSRTPKRTAEQILEGVKSTSKNKKEVIVIMHDTYGKENTVAALPSIIEYFKSLNYEFKAF